MQKIFDQTFVVLFYIVSFVQSIWSAGVNQDCFDIYGNLVSHGYLFIPGPSVCSMCACYNGQALFCKAIFCDPPYFCKEFRIGERCCEFDCLDSEEDIAKEKERLRKRKRFLGIVYGGSASKSKISNFAFNSLALLLLSTIKLIY